MNKGIPGKTGDSPFVAERINVVKGKLDLSHYVG
jgi:hypothetical protein